jgi:hypothetical protein
MAHCIRYSLRPVMIKRGLALLTTSQYWAEDSASNLIEHMCNFGCNHIISWCVLRGTTMISKFGDRTLSFSFSLFLSFFLSLSFSLSLSISVSALAACVYVRVL